MRACLHLSTESSKDSVFYQILMEDINLKENDELEYNDTYYNQLDSEARKNFDSIGLKKGKYKVTATKTEPNEYWGEIRCLFLKPVN